MYGDVQVRHINYNLDGLENGQNDVGTHVSYTFFNPKAGATFALAEGQQLYASFAVGQREPVRSDFTDRPAGDQSAQAERLNDFEGGYRLTRPNSTLLGPNTALRLEANYFYMHYRNQLVATGQLNDVGTALRTNAAAQLPHRPGADGLPVGQRQNQPQQHRSPLSRNRILDYRAVTYDADYNPVVAAEARTTTISYSPSVVSAHTLEGQPLKGLRAALLYKTVSRQYLDNSASYNRRIQALPGARFPAALHHPARVHQGNRAGPAGQQRAQPPLRGQRLHLRLPRRRRPAANLQLVLPPGHPQFPGIGGGEALNHGLTLICADYEMQRQYRHVKQRACHWRALCLKNDDVCICVIRVESAQICDQMIRRTPPSSEIW